MNNVTRKMRSREFAEILGIRIEQLEKLHPISSNNLTAKQNAKVIEDANKIIENIHFTELRKLYSEINSWQRGLSCTNLEMTTVGFSVDTSYWDLSSAYITSLSIEQIKTIKELEEVIGNLKKIQRIMSTVRFPDKYGKVR